MFWESYGKLKQCQIFKNNYAFAKVTQKKQNLKNLDFLLIFFAMQLNLYQPHYVDLLSCRKLPTSDLIQLGATEYATVDSTTLSAWRTALSGVLWLLSNWNWNIILHQLSHAMKHECLLYSICQISWVCVYTVKKFKATLSYFWLTLVYTSCDVQNR